MDIKIDNKDILDICYRYRQYGFECYLVGGCVRDLLLGKPINDFDFATNAPLERTLSLFSDKKVTQIGKNFGTLEVHYGDEVYEITRYRIDVASDGRKAEVEFADSIEVDLARRDFTMNAMAFDPFSQELVDPYGGRKDLEQGKIRFVGDTEARLREDHLRALRYYRFAARFGLETQKKDMQTILEVFDPSVLSLERIYDEISKILKLKSYDADLLVTQFTNMGVLNKVFSQNEQKKVFESIFKVSKSLIPISYALYAKNVSQGVKNPVVKTTEQSKLPARNAQIAAMAYEFKDHDMGPPVIRKILNAIKYPDPEQKKSIALEVLVFLTKGQSQLDLDMSSPYEFKQLTVNTDDIVGKGVTGKAIREIQEFLLDFVQTNPSQNTRDILLRKIDEFIKYNPPSNPLLPKRKDFYKSLGNNPKERLDAILNARGLRLYLKKFLAGEYTHFVRQYLASPEQFALLTPELFFGVYGIDSKYAKFFLPLFFVDMTWKKVGNAFVDARGKEIDFNDDFQARIILRNLLQEA